MFENMKKLIIAFTLLSMASCGIYNKYQPVEEVPENLYGEEYNSTDSTNFADMNWRDIFTDVHLQALIDSALAHNTDYLTAQWRIKEAEATLLAAKLAYVPSFSLEPQITLSSTGGETFGCQLGSGYFRSVTQCKKTGQGLVCAKFGLSAGCTYGADC